MAKQKTSESAIVKQSNEQSLTLKQAKTAIVGEYLYKFAAIDRNRVVDEELIGIFVDALGDLEPKEIKRGMERYLEQGDRFPWPSQIRELSEL